MSKVVLVGCGNVGMSYAYALVNQKTNLNELVLIDLDHEKVVGEAMDLNHCLPFTPKNMIIRAGEYKDCDDADIVVISAGANQLVGETRMDLIYKNSKIFKSIINEVMGSGFKGIFLVATNPLDIMTYLTFKYSGLPSSKVIGSGTSLDSSRLRFLIGNKLDIDPKDVHGHVIGEHGDSEFVPWSNVRVGMQDIGDFLSVEEMSKIECDVREAAYEIIKRKGSTCYGIGICLVKITNAILDNENSILTVSSYDKEHGVYVGMPTILNKDGVRDRIWVNLSGEEKDKLSNSIDVIKDAISKVEL